VAVGGLRMPFASPEARSTTIRSGTDTLATSTQMGVPRARRLPLAGKIRGARGANDGIWTYSADTTSTKQESGTGSPVK
jgi:hypothetical protein